MAFHAFPDLFPDDHVCGTVMPYLAMAINFFQLVSDNAATYCHASFGPIIAVKIVLIGDFFILSTAAWVTACQSFY